MINKDLPNFTANPQNEINDISITINISFEFHGGPWGGGNQFLKALKNELIKRGIYEKDPNKADVILINSHHDIDEAIKLKKKHQDKIFIHRIDGPVYLIRNEDLNIDKFIFLVNSRLADGTIFQSIWSKQKNYSLGLKENNFEAIIMNAVDHSIFYPKDEILEGKHRGEKWNLIATSWSPNMNKGFDLYKYLDENLDFQQYSLKFIGHSPIEFKNVIHLEPMAPNELADQLRKSDIYITGSKNDPCSNSLIEALACGLPCVVLNDGGHPEIIKNGGETFNTFEECLAKLELIKREYKRYRENIQIPNIEDITTQYTNFMKNLYIKSIHDEFKIKRLKFLDYYKIVYYKIRYLVRGFKRKMFALIKLIF